MSLHALAAALARIAGERAIDLDAIAFLGHIGPLAQLPEDPYRRVVPGHRVQIGSEARSGQRIADGRLRRQLNRP